MRAGELRHRVTLQQEQEIIDEYNTPTIAWQDLATVWAAVEPLSGREYLKAKEVQTELTARIRIRYLPGVTSAMRVLYGSRIFNIESVIDLNEQHREMHLMCSEVHI